MTNSIFDLEGEVGLDISKAVSSFDALEKRGEQAGTNLTTALERAGKRAGQLLSDGISIGLGDVGQAVDSLVSITEAGLKGIPVVGAGLAAAFHEVSGVLLDATQRGFAFNDYLKQQRIELDLVTGSASKTNQEISEISNIAFKTNVGKSFLTDAVQDLQLFNVDGQRALDLVRGLANQATATGGGAGRVVALTDLVERVMETGKLDTRAVRQLIRQKVPIYDIIADELQVSKQKAMQLINSGALSGQDLITIFTAQFNNPKWQQAAADMTQTLDGLQQRYQKGVDKLLGTATKPAYDTSVDAFKLAVDTVRGPQAGQVAASAAAAITPVTTMLDQVTKALASGDIFGGAVSTGNNIVEGLKKGVSEKASEAYKSVTDLASGAIDTAKNTLGIQSPSTVFAEMGAMAVEGFANGSGGHGGLASEESKAKVRKSLDELISVVKSHGFDITSTNGGSHNRGSAHYQGRAVDFRTKDHSDAEVRQMFDYLTASGYTVLDERQRPAGQKVWGGPHGHVQIGTEGIGSSGLSHIWQVSVGDSLVSATNPMPVSVVSSSGGWSQDQISNAQTLLSVASRMGASEKQIEALFAAGFVESKFHNLTGGMDGDNKGILQQRSNWGSVSDRMDVATAASLFLDAAKHVNQSGSPGQLAQRVQRSGFPLAYDENLGSALNMLSLLRGGANGPVPVSVVSSIVAGDVTGGVGTFTPASALEQIKDAGSGALVSVSLMQKALIPLAGDFQIVGDKAEDAGTRADASVAKIRDRVTGLRGEMRDLGLTTDNMKGIFESSFEDMFKHTQDGFKGMLRAFVLDFAQAVEQMVVKAEAAKLADLIFGKKKDGSDDSSDGSDSSGGGGLLGTLTGFLSGLFGHHAQGGPVSAGEWSWVGERGPELVRFGSNAHVYSNSDSQRMAGGQAGGQTVIQNHYHTWNVNAPAGFESLLTRETQSQVESKMAASMRSATRYAYPAQ